MTQQLETLPTERTKTRSSVLVRAGGAAALLLVLIAIGTFPRLTRQHDDFSGSDPAATGC
jgi:hypothetical protein